MRELLIFIFGLILMSCSTQPQPKEVEVKYPKEYIIVVRYTDNIVDTISYKVKTNSIVYFTIRNIQYQLMNADVPIRPTLTAGFQHEGYALEDDIAVDIRSYKIIKEIY